MPQSNDQKIKFLQPFLTVAMGNPYGIPQVGAARSQRRGCPDEEDGAARSSEGGAAPPPGRKYRARRDRCPQCRTEDVFGSSVRLRHVQDCLRRVDPEGYKARKAESKKLRGKLKLEAVMYGLIRLIEPTNRGVNLVDDWVGAA